MHDATDRRRERVRQLSYSGFEIQTHGPDMSHWVLWFGVISLPATVCTSPLRDTGVSSCLPYCPGAANRQMLPEFAIVLYFIDPTGPNGAEARFEEIHDRSGASQ